MRPSASPPRPLSSADMPQEFADMIVAGRVK
jgi:hypothetical protein